MSQSVRFLPSPGPPSIGFSFRYLIARHRQTQRWEQSSQQTDLQAKEFRCDGMPVQGPPADIVADMRHNPFFNATFAHIALPVALTVERVYLWVRVHVVDALDVANHHALLALLVGEVRKCLRSIPYELHFGIARVLSSVFHTAAHGIAVRCHGTCTATTSCRLGMKLNEAQRGKLFSFKQRKRPSS